MKLTIVGCSGSYPGPDSAASCYLVETEQDGRTWRLVLDMGNGALGALQRYADPLTIDAVLLSHLHADHCIDMTSFYVLRRYHPSGQQPPIPVWGPKGTARRLARAYDLPRKPGMREEFEFHRHRGIYQIGPFTISTMQVDHPVEAYAMRIEADGVALVYTGDTGRTDTLLDICGDADLLLAEASFREGDDNPPALHLTGRDAGEYAEKAGAKRLILTHVPPWYDARTMLEEARSAYAGPLDLAVPGNVHQV